MNLKNLSIMPLGVTPIKSAAYLPYTIPSLTVDYKAFDNMLLSVFFRTRSYFLGILLLVIAVHGASH